MRSKGFIATGGLLLLTGCTAIQSGLEAVGLSPEEAKKATEAAADVAETGLSAAATWGSGGLIAVLAGVALYFLKKRKKG